MLVCSLSTGMSHDWEWNTAESIINTYRELQRPTSHEIGLHVSSLRDQTLLVTTIESTVLIHAHAELSRCCARHYYV